MPAPKKTVATALYRVRYLIGTERHTRKVALKKAEPKAAKVIGEVREVLAASHKVDADRISLEAIYPLNMEGATAWTKPEPPKPEPPKPAATDGPSALGNGNQPSGDGAQTGDKGDVGDKKPDGPSK